MSSSAARDEDVQHLRRADAVDDLDARGPCHASQTRRAAASRPPRRSGAGSTIAASTPSASIAPVGGRRREADGRAVALDRVEQLVRRRPARAARRPRRRASGTSAPAEAERERERRAADEDVVARRRAATCAREVSHIAITSRWKCIVPFGRPVVPEVKAISTTSSAAVSQAVERLVVARHRGPSCLATLARTATQPRAAGRPRRARPASRSVAQRDARSAAVGDDLLQLLRAQQRHRRHRDAARLGHGEPAGHQHRLVRRAQQHAIAAGTRPRSSTSTCAMAVDLRSAARA